MTEIAQNVAAALSLGGLYALFSSGIALIFGVANIINFAHGQIIMVSSYLLFALSGLAWPLVVAGVIGAAVLMALVMERVAFRPARGADASTLLIISFAVGGALQAAVLLAEGATAKSVDFGATLLEPIRLGEVTFPRIEVVTLVVTGALLVGLGWMLRRTPVGVQLRAAAEDATMARLLGIAANRVIAVAFAVSGLLAGVAAVLVTVRNGSITPELGFQPVLIAFVATVIGGLGSLPGAVIGSFLLGALTIALQVLLPDDVRPYRDALLFTGVIAVLLFRPQGIIPVASQGTRV